MSQLQIEWIPNALKKQHKPCDRAFPFNRQDARADFCLLTRTIDLDGFRFGVDQPSQLRAIGTVFAHLAAQYRQAIRFRTQLNYKIGAKVKKASATGGVQLLDAANQCPGSIRRTTRAVGQDEPCGRFSNYAMAVLLGPIGQLANDLSVPVASGKMRRRCYDQFPFGSHFKIEVRIFSAESSELVVRHRIGGESCRQKSVVNCQRHGFSVSQEIADTAKAWGQNDITMSHRAEEQMRLQIEWIPNTLKKQHKPCDRTFPFNRQDARADFRLLARTIDLDRFSFGVDQPSQLRAIRNIFAHLAAQGGQTIRFRTQLNYKIRTEVKKTAAVSGVHLSDAADQCPGSVRRTTRAIGQDEPGRGVTSHSTPVLASPTVKLTAQLEVPVASGKMRRRHYDQFPFGCRFKIEVRMLSAKSGELVVRHRIGGESCRQKSVVNCQRHGFSVSQELANAAKAWGQSDDIAVATDRRNG